MRTGTPLLADDRCTGVQPCGRWSDAQVCSWAAGAVAAFIVYGSLLPFDLGRPDGLRPAILLSGISPLWPLGSLTDVFVNVTIGVPLGFFLAGALRRGRRRVGPAATTLIVGCVAVVLGAIVEVLQVLSPTRQSEWSDVLGQAVGAAVGLTAWFLAGPWIVGSMRGLANERREHAFVARLLHLFLAVYVFIQLTPLLPTDLAATYHERSSYVPLAFHFEPTFPFLRHLAANALMNIPIGALALLGWVKRGTRRGAGPALLLGLSIMTATEVAQALSWSRYASIADLCAGALGVAAGIAIAEACRGPLVTHRRDRVRQVHSELLVVAGAWMLLLFVHGWHPFDFHVTREFVAERYFVVQLVPFKSFYPGYATAPLIGLHEVLARCLVGVPLGLLLQTAWIGDRGRRAAFVAIIAIATVVFVVIEIGKVFLPIAHEFPDVTDVILGLTGAAMGAGAGAVIVRRPLPMHTGQLEPLTAAARRPS